MLVTEITQLLYWVGVALVLTAAFITLIRLAIGPTTLDRAVAVDLLTAIAIAIVALLIVWQGRDDLSSLLVIFALTGFFSSVAIARYASHEARGDKAILSREEARLEEQLRLQEEEKNLAREKARILEREEEETEERPAL